jgi:hypothetical protein
VAGVVAAERISATRRRKKEIEKGVRNRNEEPLRESTDDGSNPWYLGSKWRRTNPRKTGRARPNQGESHGSKLDGLQR